MRPSSPQALSFFRSDFDAGPIGIGGVSKRRFSLRTTSGVMMYFPKKKKTGRPPSSPTRNRQIAEVYYKARAEGSNSRASIQAVKRSVPGAAVLSDDRLLKIAQENRW